jgi:transcriptional regulator with XRE-family HTH domain
VSSVASRLGVRIRDLRLAHNLSQEQLAERAGVSYKFIGDVERGNGNPTIKWLSAVAQGLGVSLKDLVADEEDPPAISYPALSGRDYSVVREARDRLEALLQRHDDTTAPRRKRRAKPRGRRVER